MPSRRQRHLALLGPQGGTDPRRREGTETPDPADAVVLHLRGSGLSPVLDDVQEQLDAALVEAPRVLVVDLSAVGRISSTTVAALLWIKRCCAARAVDVHLRSPSRRCREAMDRVGLLGVLELEPAGVPAGRRDRAPEAGLP